MVGNVFGTIGKILTGCWLVLPAVGSQAQAPKPVVVLYPGTAYIQEIYYAKEGSEVVRNGDYYSFYEGYLPNTGWSGGKIEEDKIRGIKVRGYYKDNLRDSVWTLYFPPASDAASKFNEIREEGWYLNDKRAGIWYTFLEQGKVQKRYDFEEQRELPPIVKPRFIYPEKARAAKAEGLVSVKIIIRNCTVSKYLILKDIGYGTGEAMVKALKEAEQLKSKYGINAVDCTRQDEIITNRFKLGD